MSGRAARKSRAFKAKYKETWRLRRALLRYYDSMRPLWQHTMVEPPKLASLDGVSTDTPYRWSSRQVVFPVDLGDAT